VRQHERARSQLLPAAQPHLERLALHVGIDHGSVPQLDGGELRELLAAGAAMPNVEFRQGDGTALEIETRSVDWIWCGDVLHHVQATQTALAEFRRVVRPDGTVVIKESQVAPAMFLPGHPELERRLQAADMEWSRGEAGEQPFQERRQRTLASLREGGFDDVRLRTWMVERRAPLPPAARDYIARVIFGRNWGPRLRDLLDARDWARRSALCEPDSPEFVLTSPDYYCLYPITLFIARRPARDPASRVV
jgi:SAM-dependent methyltransferase